MTFEELEDIIKQGENQNVEFKEKISNSFLNEIVGFANATGGKLLLGVCDDGKIIGTDISNKQRSNIQNQIQQIEQKLMLK